MDTQIKKMSSYKAQVLKYGVPIQKEEYQDLRSYAKSKKIRLSCFKQYVGNIEIIKEVIDDIYAIAADFPLIIDEILGIVLELDYDMGTDFATTISTHIIHLNGVYFSNLDILISDYNDGVENKRFVQGTDWHAIIRHEVGHVVSALYNINPMKIAFSLLQTTSSIQVLDYLTDNLSLYSTEYEDGREIISESFSGYYSCVGNDFANQFIESCLKMVKGGASNEIV